MEESVLIKPTDGNAYTVSREVACMSVTIKRLMEERSVNDAIVPVTVQDRTLRVIIEYCNEHKDDAPPVPLKEDELPQLSTWDDARLKSMTMDDSMELLCASNYLEIPSLTDKMAHLVGDNVMNKKPEEIFGMFGLPFDLTPEEEQEILKENPWLVDQ